ncbi:hypothetical protein DWB85_01945 [Seongchinamella sediminis]|uniref:Outer membrane protein beta-barrel domain-containing protein n=1 Tax=Seongchinamella sediminis TaxID=2283635 RepID=A0A3L7E2P8_9GAMM|nr:hypothetical protein [Seongchinamella sediminis]RLQ23339.1 hypothetical protein DWB85_01945 [Seongchinamella sediminis]
MKSVRTVGRLSFAGTALLLAGLPAQALAQEEGWEFSLSPLYLWAKNIEGSAAVGGREAPLDLDFRDDILDNLDSAFAFHFEARKNRLTLYAEYNYAKLDPTTGVSIGPVEIRSEVEFEDLMWEAGALWAFAEHGDCSWELLGAVRYAEQDLEVKIARSGGPGILPIPDRISGGDNWWQGVAGLRYTFHATDSWSWRLRGDYGYGDSDNASVSGAVFLSYRFNDWGSVFGGYRYLDTDYDNGRSSTGGYVFDGDQQGPVLGLNLHF